LTNNNNSLNLYSAFLCTQSVLHGKGNLLNQPPPMCSIHLDGSHIAPSRFKKHTTCGVPHQYMTEYFFCLWSLCEMVVVQSMIQTKTI